MQVIIIVIRRKAETGTHNLSFPGHFTQLVWANSKHFGLGKARSRSGKIVVVAHYAPVGNICGAYLQNVFPPCEELPRFVRNP